MKRNELTMVPVIANTVAFGVSRDSLNACTNGLSDPSVQSVQYLQIADEKTTPMLARMVSRVEKWLSSEILTYTLSRRVRPLEVTLDMLAGNDCG